MTTVEDLKWRDAAIVLAAEQAREQAEIHNAVCRYLRRGLRCSTCTDTRERAARLACARGESYRFGDDPEWGPDSATQQLERGPR
jgi:hypothetical protein